MATKPAELYDEDFYAWTQQQAEALRTHFRGDNRLDVEHLAEEIEDLGKSDLHAVESFVEQIIAHLLNYSGQDSPRAHWRAEVLNFRKSAHRKMTPSMRRRIQRKLDVLYRNGRQTAAAGTLVHEPDLLRRLPKTCSYDWDTIWHLDVLAEAGVHLPKEEESDAARGRSALPRRGRRTLNFDEDT